MRRAGRTMGMALAAVLCVALIPGLTALAFGQTTQAAAENPESEEVTDPGLLAWRPRLRSPYATGDWRGDRTWLEDRDLGLIAEQIEPFPAHEIHDAGRQHR